MSAVFGSGVLPAVRMRGVRGGSMNPGIDHPGVVGGRAALSQAGVMRAVRGYAPSADEALRRSRDGFRLPSGSVLAPRCNALSRSANRDLVAPTRVTFGSAAI